ncbi:hypothetical protein F4819DRAFT_258390 [Hypoxylon fuscum]|nr:hypothetical protein F4819DRAFT_258390 [Hypoxylon fuscum]
MPAFIDSTTFPAFYELPSSSTAITTGSPPADWFLVAQIKENMTITKPTVIARDRTGAEFAVTFDDGDHRGLGDGKARLKKGHTLVVPRATRTDREGEAKKAIVRVPEGASAGVKVIPGSLEQVFELGLVLLGIEESSAKKCAACGEAEGERPLLRCTGCGAAAYCSKACQVRGWSEMGHKANCKVIKSIKEIWP